VGRYQFYSQGNALAGGVGLKGVHVIVVAAKLSISRCCIRGSFRWENGRKFLIVVGRGGSVGVAEFGSCRHTPRLFPFTCIERSPASIYSSSTMLNAIPNYFYERRNGLLRATGCAGVAYLVTSYVKEQLQDVKDEVLLKRKAREK